MAKIKKTANRYNRWVILRKGVQGLTLAVFLGFFLFTRRDGLPPDLANAFMRLDPLAVLAHLFASRTFLAGSSLALVVVLLTLLAGRAWCGWLCPLGTILDIFSFKKVRKNRQELSRAWHQVKFVLLAVVLVAALLGNLTLLILDPITLLYRTLTASLYPGLDRAVLALEEALYPIPLFSELVARFDQAVRPALLPSQPYTYRNPLLFAAIFSAVIGLNLAAPRFWCRVICPLGAFLGLLSKVSLFRRKIIPGCIECNRCAHTCPTGAVNPADQYATRISECTLCMDCFAVCPADVTRLQPGLRPASWGEFDPTRRQVLTGIGLTIAATAVIQADWRTAHPYSFLIQPPGAADNDLFSRCVRCGLCVRACPTGVLQPSLLEAGLTGLWTPILVSENGYCDYACNVCGQVCPVGAIPPLSLEEKRQVVLGKAYIDQHRCIAWSGDSECIVCEEMCPLPDKAITIQTRMVEGEDGVVEQKLPVVDRQKCIGCGICEFKCPVVGDAAIRVYTPGLGVEN